jgi:hypothetical protein
VLFLLNLKIDLRLKTRNDRISLVVFTGRIVGRTRDNEGSSGLIDKDCVNLVYNCKVMRALDAAFEFKLPCYRGDSRNPNSLFVP